MDNIFDQFQGQNQFQKKKIATRKMLLDPILGIFIMKTCSLITVRFYFGFQKFVMVDRFATKFFFNTIADSISNIIMYS